MVHTVINKRNIILLLILFSGFKVWAQQVTEPAFNYISPKTHKKVALNDFLGAFLPVKLVGCVSASGTFRFKVKLNGKIDRVEYTGSLPDTLVHSIKKQIKATEDHWKFIGADSDRWFVQPVFVEIQLTKDCPDNKTIEDAYTLLTSLFDKKQQVITTPTSYLISPIYLFGVR